MAETENLRSVVLNDRHVALEGRMVPFGGYSLPVQYPDGIVAEHKWTRQSAGLFDVSHMGPSFVRLNAPTGDADADHAAIAALIEPLICGDIAGLKPGRQRYTMLLNAEGGILDDLMIARPAEPDMSGTLYVVVNAGTKDADFDLIETALGSSATLSRADDGALLALQGPEAANVLHSLFLGVTELNFMSCAGFTWQGHPLVISRSGYTGEDGFEILVPAAAANKFWDALTADARVKPIGLGARDSLRLEAGLPLYGHDLDETVSPVEAGMGFAVSKRRREAADFNGAKRILAEREGALSRVRVGLFVDGAPAREGAEIVDDQGNQVGVVTSGGFSPSLGKAIALGFVPPTMSEIGTDLAVKVRGRTQSAKIAQTPFVPHNYFRKTS